MRYIAAASTNLAENNENSKAKRLFRSPSLTAKDKNSTLDSYRNIYRYIY